MSEPPIPGEFDTPAASSDFGWGFFVGGLVASVVWALSFFAVAPA
jgi:hypothetical protein